MTNALFRDVIENFQSGSRAAEPAAPSLTSLSVIGTGPDALAVAVAAAGAGLAVRLGAVQGAADGRQRLSSAISVRGEDLVGNYAIAGIEKDDRSQDAPIQWIADIGRAIAGTDAVIVAESAGLQGAAATMLAPHLRPDQIVGTLSGGLWAAAEFDRRLSELTDSSTPVVAIHGRPWVTSLEGTTLHIGGRANSVECSGPAEQVEALRRGMLPMLSGPVDYMTGSLGGPDWLVAAAAAIQRLGVARDDTAPLAATLDKSVSTTTLASIDTEVCAVARRLNTRREPIGVALSRMYGAPEDLTAEGDDLASAFARLPAFDRFRVDESDERDAVLFGLVPIEDCAAALDVPVPVISAFLTLYEARTGLLVRGRGRGLTQLGLREGNDETRRADIAACVTPGTGSES